MKALFALLSYLIFSLMTHAQSPADDAQIKTLVQHMEDGWGKKDGKLFAKGFADNADYVVINGMYINGKENIAGGHQGIFDSFYKETTLEIGVLSIRYLRPDIAIVHVNAHLTGNSMGKPVNHKAMITLVAEKTTNGWQIDAFQNTKIEEQPKR